MLIVKQKQTNLVEANPTTQIYEYLMDEHDLSGATAIITGRYPEKGFATNTISKELVLVLDGEGILGTEAGKTPIEIGDCILLQPNERFFWQGHLTLFVVCTPAFSDAQHKISAED